MADNEPHAVVRLLLARMESHPEEFSNDNGRWVQWLDELMPFVTEKERLMLRKPMMQTIHEDVMDELLNGPERRRKHKEDTEYERHLAQAMQHTQRQAMQGIVGAYSGGGGGGSGASLPVSTGPYSSGGGGTNQLQGVIGSTPLRVSPTITGTKANSIMIDDQVLDGPMIKKIKRMLSGRRK
jgi:hypothetical protein